MRARFYRAVRVVGGTCSYVVITLCRGLEDAYLAAGEREPDTAHSELMDCIMKTVYAL